LILPGTCGRNPNDASSTTSNIAAVSRSALDIPAELTNVRRAVLALGGEVTTFNIKPPIDVAGIEKQIPGKIPPLFRTIFLEQ